MPVQLRLILHLDVVASVPPGGQASGCLSVLWLTTAAGCRKRTPQVIAALIDLNIIIPTADMVSIRRSLQFFLTQFQAASQREETIGAIGEDLFAIAVDQPFRFPAAFTFVLRAFSTLEGLGKVGLPSSPRPPLAHRFYGREGLTRVPLHCARHPCCKSLCITGIYPPNTPFCMET